MSDFLNLSGLARRAKKKAWIRMEKLCKPVVFVFIRGAFHSYGKTRENFAPTGTVRFFLKQMEWDKRVPFPFPFELTLFL